MGERVLVCFFVLLIYENDLLLEVVLRVLFVFISFLKGIWRVKSNLKYYNVVLKLMYLLCNDFLD